MLITQSLSLALLIGVAGPQTTKPQDPKSTRPAEQTRRDDMDPARYQTTRFADLEELADADVKLMADAEDRAEAAEDGERADRPSCSIDDLLIDHKEGRIVGAIVSVGGFLGVGDKKVAIPYDALSWNATDDVWMLSATEDELKTMGRFDMDRARKEGVDPMMLKTSRPIESSSSKAMKGMHDSAQEDHAQRKDSAYGDEQGKDMQADKGSAMVSGDKRFSRVSSGLCFASKLDGKPIYTPSEKFGDVSRLIVDRQSGEIEFIVVSHGGMAGIGDEQYLLPFEALTYCRLDDDKGGAVSDTGSDANRLDDDKGERALCIERSTAELEAGVRYEEPEEGVLDADTARQVQQRFADRG
jgi:sporulation protein YlmC with PRC-barrel domain